ncbi:TetR family transcriptional regulator [Prauserella marina]|nr:TetR/AcrR family transcriptional regulator [Prauserella marina]ASR39795.1 TetR family transcriptional regulator [Prauserella marina]
MPAAHRTARERARAEVTAAIKDEARTQLAKVGAEALSLRAVARQLGMVSSALYRYFPRKDDLLTALIVDAYNSLGTTAEAAAGTETHPRARWQATCHAIRAWARANPHEYSLIFGSPIPGYAAPVDTITPASRVPLALIAVVTAAVEQDLISSPHPQPALTAPLEAQAADVGARFAPGIPAPVLARLFVAWTQLFGMLSFELTGQFANSLEPADAFFGYAVDDMATFVGLH